MTTEEDLIRANLAQLLKIRSPELGARLKQRLLALLRQQGNPSFDERKLGFRGFRAYLQAHHSDWLDIGEDTRSGDILISLRPSASVATQPMATPPQHPEITPVRSDIWQAFTNPDPKRRRYFNALTGEVLHFAEGEGSMHERQVHDAREHFIEIEPISGDSHQKWMREFLDSVPITGSERVPYDAILKLQYSSDLNATFTRALGDHAPAWRELRTVRILDVIAQWANGNQVSAERLRAENKKAETVVPPRQEDFNSDRAKALKLLDLIDDTDINRVVLPMLLVTIMVKARN